MRLNDDILTSALKIYNDNAMNSIPDIIDTHNYSRRFERKIERIMRAHRSFKGSLKIERIIRYSTRLAMVIVCLMVINVFSINAFHYNLWDAVYNEVGDMINVNFKSKETEHIVTKENAMLKITSIPAGYEMQEEYFSENLSVQNFKGENGTITYTEGLITETAEVNMKKNKGETEQILVGAREVTLSYGEENITALFQDNQYYHIIEVQGLDANEKFVTDIIRKLEAQ